MISMRYCDKFSDLKHEIVNVTQLTRVFSSARHVNVHAMILNFIEFKMSLNRVSH